MFGLLRALFFGAFALLFLIPVAILLAVIVFVAALCAAVFLLCTHIGKLLGVTGNIVLSRLLGVLLAALAVQFVVDGVRAALA